MSETDSFPKLSTTPVVSFVLVCYNHEAYISEAVESVLNQTFQDFEVIVVDDGSSDKTFELVNQFKDPRIRAFRQTNSGPSAATNKGIQESRGAFIAFLSGDDMCHPDRLKVQLDDLARRNLDALFALPHIIDERGKLKDDSFFPVFFGRSWSSTPDLFRQLFYHGNFICGVSAFLKARVFKAPTLPGIDPFAL